jgi:CHAT domain-containing protein
VNRFAIALAVGAALADTGTTAAATPRPDPFAACRRQFADRPLDYESSYCFYQAALQGRLWDEAARTLAGLMREHPDNFWLALASGHIHRDRDPARTETLYRQAADGFAKQRNAGGEILARGILRSYLLPRGRLREATAEMDRVAAVGASVDDPMLKAQAWTVEATHVQETGGDLGVAYRLLRQSEQAIFPHGSYRLKRNCLNALGSVAFRLGRVDEALAIYERLDQLAAAANDVREQAATRYNILNASSMKETMLPSPGARQQLMRLAEQSLASGLRAEHALVALKTHRTIAALLAHEPASRGKALAHVKECLDLAAATRQPHDESLCSWVEASILRNTAPRQARAAAARAVAAATRASSLDTQAYSAGRHMQFSWDTRPRQEAIADSLAAIDAIETLRSLQDDADSSAELFSTWTLDYYWLSGRLLSDPDEGDLDLAFSITERLRARSLLDQIKRSRNRVDPSHPAVASRRSLLEAIVPVQRRLMDPAIREDERRKALQQLDDLERREQEAQRQIEVASNRRGAMPAFASLDAVQSALGDNEALLSFQVGVWETYEGEFGGGSWLIAITRRGRSVYRIPDRAQLAPIIPVFTGLLTRKDGADAPASARLYHDVLGEALSALPPGIERLIIVPDGPLHQLPFDALRAGRDQEPLATRYELAIAPSATLWLHWRTIVPRSAKRRALVFADPELPISSAREATERNVVLQQGLRLGRLPHARRESRALEQHLGGVDALVGTRASERALKDRRLRDYEIVHVAAHAIADERRPERSAVLLSPGAAGEDGLLQAREIAGLDLEGRIVVLSACQTASGAVLSGEGVLSLARAFFEAGAQSIVGTRWPIRDDDAAALFDTFYRVLGSGASVSKALMQAKVEAIAAGRPAAAWAGLVALGNGAARPFPPPRRDTRPAIRYAAALGFRIVILIGLTAYLATRGRGRHS